MSKAFHKANACYCGGKKKPCLCRKWEKKLEKEGLGHLDYEDGKGNVMPTQKGSGNLGDGHVDYDTAVFIREQASEEITRRNTVLANHSFRSARDKGIYARHASGESMRAIGRTLRSKGRSVWAVHDVVKRIEHEYLADRSVADLGVSIEALLDLCNGPLLATTLRLLRAALDTPEKVRPMLEAAENHEDIRAACNLTVPERLQSEDDE